MNPIVCLTILLAAQPADLLAQLRSDDPAVRLRAVQAVERAGAEGTPDESYLAPLAGLLRDPDAQTRGLAALALSRHVVACKGKVPDGVVIPLLLALRDDNPHVGALCKKSLTFLGARIGPQVEAATARDRPRAERLAGLAGCRPLMALPAGPDIVEPICWALLADPDAAVRGRAVVILEQLRAEHPRPPFRDVARLRAALRVPEDRIRALAAEQLPAIGDAALPILLDLLDDKDRDIRTASGKAIARLLDAGMEPSPDQLTRLLAALVRPAVFNLPALRESLQRSAGDHTPPTKEVIAEVDRMLALLLDRNKDPEPARHFFEAANSGQVVQVLVDRLLADDPRIPVVAADQLRVLYGLGARTSRKSLLTLAKLLGAPGPEAFRAAAFTLRAAIHPELTIPAPVLTALQVGVLRDDITGRLACAQALAHCGLQAEPALVALLQDRNPEVQMVAADAVMVMATAYKVAPLTTVAHLERLTRSTDRGVRMTAKYALGALESLTSREKP
jgi:HEAT repeat protein